MPAAATRRRLNDAISALHRFAGSRKLDAMHAERAGVDLNLAAYGVLGRIVEHGPVSLGELSKLGHMQPSALSRQVKLLEDGGHIERTSGDDARVALVEATAAGREAHRRLRDANEALLSRQLKGWTEEELLDVAEKLERLVADLRR
ncbi:MAG: transcriptional regulator [Actinomycetia bacterium]|nr:transcriptional regulator [Actinomycetes bacterium]